MTAAVTGARQRTCLRLLVLLALSRTAGCATLGAELQRALEDGTAEGAAVRDVPFVAQVRDDDCGPAAAAILLRHAGLHADLGALTERMVREEVQGSYTTDFVATLRAEGLVVHEREGASFEELTDRLEEGAPIALLLSVDPSVAGARLHYVVVTGYDREREVVLLHDGARAHALMERADVMRRWNDARRWMAAAATTP